MHNPEVRNSLFSNISHKNTFGYSETILKVIHMDSITAGD